MKLRHRALLRAGVAATALVAASAAFTAPAFADDTADLGVSVAGTILAPDSDNKFATISLSNAGPNAASEILVTIDVSGLDLNKVEFVGEDCGGVENGKVLCSPTSGTLAAGAEQDWEFPLVKKAGATGEAGPITVTVEHPGTDPEPANNSATADVVVSDESGADLLVWAPDVYQWDDTEKFFTTTPIAPGGESRVYVEVFNYGDKDAKGLAFKVSLPEHVTLTEPETECDFSEDLRVAACDYADVALPTFGSNPDKSWSIFYWSVKVDESAPAPVTLHGSVTAAAIEEVDVEVPAVALRNAPIAAELPEHFKDVDKSDNTDEFGVFVATAAAGGSGGGDGGLPLTGPAAGVIGGVGLAVVLVGGALFFVARRRRIVTVTPDN